ncbi:type VI secretion system Vgr family protein [Polyangium mundeleinium]|uniref:Type VI secretion system tip protein TssI/VgrG n=1 Tax=Polyangium mundeleinium TaxID=2995306 RepID=A0ABT5ES61_9BACT|nr:type VI secretion system tip protein TssI/VgrG [Polyangium mundeleinium]MDC0744591.1 type VI secretion system tip protein TssI/VgrG [Polyangium mundeleinium]
MRGLRLIFESFQPKSPREELSVRTFSVREAISEPFEVSILARSHDASIDLEAIVGKPAAFLMDRGEHFSIGQARRRWEGICTHIEQIRVEDSETGESTYTLTILPKVWLLGQRLGYRVFQHLSIPDIVDKLLGEWKIQHKWAIDRGAYPRLEYRVQHGESELAFLSRLLEEAGIAYTFPDEDGAGTMLQFSDALAAGKPHPHSPLTFDDAPNRTAPKEYVTAVHMSHRVRPGAYVVRDHDFRRPDFPSQGEAPKALDPEHRYEQYHYRPGALLVETTKGAGATPVADDKGMARRDEAFGVTRATQSLQAERHEKRVVTYTTNSMILAPGVIFAIQDHPHQGLAQQRLLVTELCLSGSVVAEWEMSGRAAFAADPYRPPLVTPKPRALGMESAVVVGPRGQEIHTDEFGRIRVQFPWDREGKHDDDSSCWIRVSQGWAGTGMGSITIPRVGQEVLVGFLGGDPDQPVVVGRVFNGKNLVPHKLPEHKTRSTLKSASSPGGGGSNELLFEDARGKELVYVQAQRDLHARVLGDEQEQIQGDHRMLVGKRQDIVIKAEKKELVVGRSDLHVGGDERRQVDGKASITVGGSRHEKVQRSHALEAGQEIHLAAGTSVVIEGALDLTLKGPGGFIRIDPSGVSIVGNLVRINSGGAPGAGSGARPDAPEDAIEAVAELPGAGAP